MGRVNIVLDEDAETLLRNHIKKKGDISKIVSEATRKYLSDAKGMRSEREVRKQYNEVLAELEREPNSRTKGYSEALEWVLKEE